MRRMFGHFCDICTSFVMTFVQTNVLSAIIAAMGMCVVFLLFPDNRIAVKPLFSGV